MQQLASGNCGNGIIPMVYARIEYIHMHDRKRLLVHSINTVGKEVSLVNCHCV